MTSDECVLGHAWECFSGDTMNCINCDAEGEVRVTYEPSEVED
jgi:hypothetical protein